MKKSLLLTILATASLTGCVMTPEYAQGLSNDGLCHQWGQMEAAFTQPDWARQNLRDEVLRRGLQHDQICLMLAHEGAATEGPKKEINFDIESK